MPAKSSRSPLKILCLHGLTENAEIMQKKLEPMMQRLPEKDFQFVFISAPFILPEVGNLKTGQNNRLTLKANVSEKDQIQDPKQKEEEIKAYFATSYHRAIQSYDTADAQRKAKRKIVQIERLGTKYDAMLKELRPELKDEAERNLYNLQGKGRRWWTLPDEAKNAKMPTFIGHEAGFVVLSEAMKEYGPFDGLIGFSTGAMMGNFCQSMLLHPESRHREPSFQPPESQGPFKFVISFAPWLVAHGPHLQFLKDQEAADHSSIPSLVYEGVKDRFCRKGTCQTFAQMTSAERHEMHTGGHSIPFWGEYPSFLAEWLRVVARQCQGEIDIKEGRHLRNQLLSPYATQEAQRSSARL